MSFDQPQDLHCLVLMNGTIFAQVDDAETAAAQMEIAHGATGQPFVPCTNLPALSGILSSEQVFSTSQTSSQSYSEPAEASPGDVFACWINELSDWSLIGSDTTQVMISNRNEPCRIHLAQSLQLGDVTETDRLTACLGSHRAKANLNIAFVHPKTGQTHHKTYTFDPRKRGGPQKEFYLEISCHLSPELSGCDVSLQIDYAGYIADGTQAEPFLFIADAKLCRDKDPEAKDTPIVAELLYGTPNTSPGEWVMAHPPQPLRPGQQVKIQHGAIDYPVLPMTDPEFVVTENYGHTLICQAAGPLDVMLSIGGVNIGLHSVNAQNGIIRLPNSVLDGAVHHLSIKDKTGSVILFETQQLTPNIVTPFDVMQRESKAPFATSLFAQTPHRYAALKSCLAHANQIANFDQLAYALDTLEKGHANVSLKPLSFPEIDRPDVSVIIPAHNKIELTYFTLCSLLLAHNAARFEVIVVDDGSIDETAHLEKIVSGITVVHNKSPQRFIRACNEGAALARGKYLTLLNNDVEVTAGWLDSLIDAFDRFENVGLAGSKLLYPDGKLQEAGGIVWGNGNPWNYGNRHNPNEPCFSYARQADYLSGAALMVPKTLWDKVGGLSSYLEPMYFEDTDLAFKVRDAGFDTWFVPSSVVYHHEGMTSGKDVNQGFKRHQEVNRPKFKRRWASAFAIAGEEGHRPDLEKDRGIQGRVLFIDYAVPRPDKDAGSYAAFEEMKLVQSLGYKVSFLATNMAHLGAYTEDLQNAGIEAIYAPFFMNVSEYLDAHAQDFDAFYLTRYYVAQAVLSELRAKAPNAKVLFNNADLHFLREMRTARSENNPNQLDHARHVRDEEVDILKKVDVVLSYTDVEHSVIEAYTDGQADVVKCPWVANVPSSKVHLKKRAGLSFLGSHRHHPNVEGITWFTRTVLPLLDATDPQNRLHIYGSGMKGGLQDLNAKTIKIPGFVESISDAFTPHRIFVAPLRSGAGIKGKVISAMAHGIPCVMTPIAAEGIGARSGFDCIIAQSEADWVCAINTLNTDDDMWREVSKNAQTYIANQFSFAKGREMMRSAFEAADLFGSKP